MIDIKDKKDCCGCHACVAVCARQCITMQQDREGFLYPQVDVKACTDCGLCEKVCPVINQGEPHRPLKVYAARNRNEEVRKQSSSGGIFTLLAESVIREGGVVFGAKFDADWNVAHAWTDSIDGIAAFRGSKYVQSVIGDTYKEAKEFLLQGRNVLFTGTPCQIAGLKKYLRKEYDNLLTVDVICHGVPSPLVWQKYLHETIGKLRKKPDGGKNAYSSSMDELPVITGISFRDKACGWGRYGFSLNYASSIAAVERDSVPTMEHGNVFSQSAGENVFMNSFLSCLNLRPSCYRCPSKSGKSGSDMTIADFWGIEKYNANFTDDKGTSAVLLNTEKGHEFFDRLDAVAEEHPLEQLKREGTTYYRSVEEHPKREEFFERLDAASLDVLVNEYAPKKKSKRKPLLKRLAALLKPNDFRIIWDKPGQTCNRLWSYLDTIAWAVRTRHRTYILFWDRDIKHFDRLRNNPYVKFPLYNKTLIKWLGDARYQNLLTKLFANRFLNRFYGKTRSKKFVSGWKKRASNEYFPYVMETIHELYAPNQKIMDEVQSALSRYREEGYFIIGIHIRRGDYKTFEGGKYYFELEEYRTHMQALCELYRDKKVCFFLSTNEKIDRGMFAGLEICEHSNTTAIHDLYMLSLCDRIVGPLSTFSRWASFYGQVPLCFIERDSVIRSDTDFSIIKDFYHFENGMEIENLTDKIKR